MQKSKPNDESWHDLWGESSNHNHLAIEPSEFDHDVQIGEAEQGLKYATFKSETPNTLSFPMFVVEDQTTLDIHDCYMRSIRKDPPQAMNSYETMEMANAFIKQ